VASIAEVGVSPRIQARLRPALALAAALIVALALWLSARWTHQRGLDALAAEGEVQLELYAAYLQGVLEKYEALPELLSTNKRLVSFLRNPRDPERIEAFNRYLETINSISDAADTYLMNAEGLTIAASNWQAERPFVGRNFSYRPYFQQAMQGRLGRYFALGTTSNRRGYYFAYPVRDQGTILGAVVVKIDIDSVERDWGRHSAIFLVTDPDGVVFVTTRPDWRFRTLEPLSEVARERILNSRRYPQATLEPLALRRVADSSGDPSLRLRVGGDPGSGATTYLQLSRTMPEAGWAVHILSDTAAVKRRMIQAMIATGAALLIAFLLTLTLWQRRRGQLNRRHYEAQSRAALERANDQLEARVAERTVELTDTNAQLQREVEERRRAEQALQHARKELIQAAKLAALGQMSAGISHELNQPLAAIRTYSDNGRLLLEKGRIEDARWNLDQINELTERMAQIGAQLKVFARKTSGQITEVALLPVIDGALRILAPGIRRAQATVEIDVAPRELNVRANDVLLQQVLVNLLGNALHAVEDRDERVIRVVARRVGAMIEITIEDTGRGIDPDHLPHIFEPFFTTKASGQGLGLGLTITYRILQEMQGSIETEPGEHGARFRIRLPEA
jgi:two-component system C4-dicarboxylate transport sensor histidine kinase DctB